MKFLKNLGVVAASAMTIGLSAPANACVGNQCPAASNTTTNLPAPAPRVAGFNFGWNALSQAAGAAQWGGTSGRADTVKDGFLRAEVNLNAAGSGCVTGCGNTEWSLKLHSMEQVRASASSHSNLPGMVSSVGNTMAAQGTFGWMTQPITTAQSPR